MKVESYEKKDGILQVMLCAEAEEFREARRRAYLEHTDRYPVPGCAGGLASLTDLENVYGPAVLYDEALELAAQFPHELFPFFVFHFCSLLEFAFSFNRAAEEAALPRIFQADLPLQSRFFLSFRVLSARATTFPA